MEERTLRVGVSGASEALDRGASQGGAVVVVLVGRLSTHKMDGTVNFVRTHLALCLGEDPPALEYRRRCLQSPPQPQEVVHRA